MTETERAIPTALIGCLAVLLFGCDLRADRARASDPSPGTVSTDTISGVVHVTNRGAGQWTARTAWRTREIFRFGGRDEPVHQLFSSQLLGTAIGPDGNVYVLDHLAATISAFDTAGRLVRTIGQRGRGPSDLATPTGFTWCDDGLMWVSDPENLKYAVFDSIGEFVRTSRRSIFAYPRRQYPLVCVPGTGVIDEAATGEKLLLLRTTADGEVHDTLMAVDRPGPFSPEVRDVAVTRPGPEFTRVATDYTRRLRWAVDPSGGIWLGSPEELRFVKLDWSADTLLVVTADHRESKLTPADERLISAALRQSGLDRSQINPIRPLFQALHVMEGGYLLVQLVDTPGEASPSFDVYDSGGRYLGELDLGFAPNRLGSLGSRGNILVAPMLGELDVPYVVGVEVVRPVDERSPR